MNDNNLACALDQSLRAANVSAQDRQLAITKPLAGRAIATPDALTSDEVQELGWGLLVALKRLEWIERGEAWDAS